MRLRLPRFFERHDGTLSDLLDMGTFNTNINLPLTSNALDGDDDDDLPRIRYEEEPDDATEDSDTLLEMLNERVETILDEDMLTSVMILAVSDLLGNPVRSNNIIPPNPPYEAMWEKHVEELEARNLFCHFYRMTRASFDKIVDAISPELAMRRVSYPTSRRPIPEAIRLHCYLRYVFGGSYLDIMRPFNIAPSSFYVFVWHVKDAINDVPELGIHFPTTPAEISEAVEGFALKSHRQVMRGCIGSLDGLHVSIRAPNVQDGLYNVKAFYSGEKVEIARERDYVPLREFVKRCSFPQCRHYWGEIEFCPDERCNGESNFFLYLHLIILFSDKIRRALHGLRY